MSALPCSQQLSRQNSCIHTKCDSGVVDRQPGPYSILGCARPWRYHQSYNSVTANLPMSAALRCAAIRRRRDVSDRRNIQEDRMDPSLQTEAVIGAGRGALIGSMFGAGWLGWGLGEAKVFDGIVGPPSPQKVSARVCLRAASCPKVILARRSYGGPHSRFCLDPC